MGFARDIMLRNAYSPRIKSPLRNPAGHKAPPYREGQTKRIKQALQKQSFPQGLFRFNNLFQPRRQGVFPAANGENGVCKEYNVMKRPPPGVKSSL